MEEILHQLIGGLSMFIPLFIGFQPSKVVQDFFHPQYVSDSTNQHNNTIKKILYTICVMFQPSWDVPIYEIVADTKDMQTLRPFPNGEQYSQPMVLELLLHFLVVFSTHPKIFHWMAPLVFSMCWMNFMNMTNMFFWLVVEPPL